MEVKIESLDHNGNGIAKINEKITFIENALPEETVTVKITKEHKNFNEGVVTKYITKSSHRIDPPCLYYGICGGCDIMHMDYKMQTKYKQEKVKNILKKYSKIDTEPEIISSNKQYNYRNKVTLHYKNKHLGYMKKKTNEIIEIDNCMLAMDNINKFIKEHKNVKKDIIIRENNSGEIVTSEDNKTMIEEINGLKFKVDANSFFQVNHYICSQIFDIIEKEIDKCNTCLDLYSGVGTLSIVASKKASVVYSIEVNVYSHQNALENLILNKISNVNFILGKVEDEIKKINEKIDIILTDPPRKGMDTNTINIIKDLSPNKIIYISCDPMTLSRDLNLLENYKLEKIYVLDMFPNTKHVESLCVLNKQ